TESREVTVRTDAARGTPPNARRGDGVRAPLFPAERAVLADRMGGREARRLGRVAEPRTAATRVRGRGAGPFRRRVASTATQATRPARREGALRRAHHRRSLRPDAAALLARSVERARMGQLPGVEAGPARASAGRARAAHRAWRHALAADAQPRARRARA